MQRLKSSRAVSARPALQQDERVLARWLTQANQDQSGVQLARLTHETAFGVVYLQMQQYGEQLRQEAYAALTGGHHVNPRTAPPTSRTSLMTAAGRHVLGIEILSEPGMPDVTPDDVLFAGAGRPPFAWIQTFQREHTMRVPKPIMHVVDSSKSLRDLMFWDMACVLGRFVKDLGMYRHGLADYILPPDPRADKSLTPLVHAFARAFLGLGHECPVTIGCSCLAAQFEMARVPEGLLPQPTQPVSTQALRQELARQTTPPNGIRWQAWREEQEKKTQKELRGLYTPPPDGDER